MKFLRHLIFANFAIKKKLPNLSDVKNKCREHNMTQKFSDKLGKIQERISLVFMHLVYFKNNNNDNDNDNNNNNNKTVC